MVSGDGSQIDSMTVENVEGSTCTFVSASTSDFHRRPRVQSRHRHGASHRHLPQPRKRPGYGPPVHHRPLRLRYGCAELDGYRAALSPRDVTLKAKPKKVEKGEKTRLTAKVSPCGGHEGDTVDLYRGSKKIATKASNASCVAKFKVKMKKTAKFQAVSPQQDADHLEGVSNKLKVKVVV